VCPAPSYELTDCPVCDSRESSELADAAAVKAEVELLWAFHERRMKAGVPPEHLTDRLAFSQYPPIRLAECERCSHVYRNPWERKKSLESAYAAGAPDPEVLQALHDTQYASCQAQLRRLTAAAGSPGRGLEVGSYVGGFLAAARDAGWVFQGVDINEGVSAFVAEKGLTATVGELTDVDGKQAFDAIAIWNTFEQLYDTGSALLAARRLLRKGGTLVVRIPNGTFYGKWRRRLSGALGGVAVRLLAHNNLLSFPYRQAFSRRSVILLLERCGFELVTVFGDTLVPVADEWTTTYGAIEERVVKGIQRRWQRGWRAPWIEVYAK
jgi:SAM-dependent methyltransferase